MNRMGENYIIRESRKLSESQMSADYGISRMDAVKGSGPPQ